MKAIIKYLSLLLCSGLIIAFYYIALDCNKLSDAYVSPREAAQIKHNTTRTISQETVNEVAAKMFPVLKSLISL